MSTLSVMIIPPRLVPAARVHSHRDDARWAAVRDRDASADGRFWFSVATTGVFCRPGCTARTPLRKNVRFHDSITDAKAAGFRACKRCNPEGVNNAQANAALVEAACRRIEQSEREPTLTQLAAEAQFSPFHFQRLFKSVVGVSPKQYAKAQRNERLRATLQTAASVTDAMLDAGISASSRLYADAAETLGMQPRDYRAGGQHMEIRYAIGDCSLGRVLVAETDKGLCAITLDASNKTLVDDLHARFRNARVLHDDARLARHLAQVIALVDAPDTGTDLPLDIRGTAFQQRVWQALRRIPVGETISYTQLAERIGAPRATRAVASACAANKLAVAIPCHRVVRGDGAMGGYRWGVERKQALLQREVQVSAKRGTRSSQ